jgi:hypothetical protein
MLAKVRSVRHVPGTNFAPNIRHVPGTNFASALLATSAVLGNFPESAKPLSWIGENGPDAPVFVFTYHSIGVVMGGRFLLGGLKLFQY